LNIQASSAAYLAKRHLAWLVGPVIVDETLDVKNYAVSMPLSSALAHNVHSVVTVQEPLGMLGAAVRLMANAAIPYAMNM
jgi:hypothetical protein